MKRFLFLAAVIAAALSVSAVAFAGTGNNGNGATTTHFTATYTDPVFGPVVCSGENIFKTAPNAFNKDSEDCTILNGGFVGVYVNVYPWASDSSLPSASAGKQATSVTITVTANLDGTSNENIVAYY